jgi:putative salt-induced outer membrane protein
MRIQILRTLAPAAASVALVALVTLAARSARADDTYGAPPPEAKALVAAPKAAADAPKQDTPLDETNATIAAGGQIATGNSKLVAGTVNGKFDMRRGANGFGTSLVGNYGEGGKPNRSMETTVQNLQLRARYDRYLIDRLSLFLIGTGRHDRFQGLDVRLNIDPGVKYLFVNEDPTKFWVEGGYDFQYDVRREDARGVPDPVTGIPQVDANGDPVKPLLAKTGSDNSGRLFVGFKHAFNKEVTFTTGLEYLQSFVESERYRVNYDALIAANVGGGFAVGFGFTARYDHAPLPGKESLDTTTTFSLIYAYSDVAPPPPPPPAPAAGPPPAPASDALPPPPPPPPPGASQL